MDKNKVGQIARDHKELAEGHDLREHPDTDAACREEARALDQLWQQIEHECAEYCAAYNEAFGAVRIRSEVHADTIVVRSQPDQQDTLVFRRTVPSRGHPGSFEAHRYHYPAHPVDLPVGLRPTSGALTLTHRDQDVTPGDLVLELLSTYTEQLARAERRRANANLHAAGDE